MRSHNDFTRPATSHYERLGTMTKGCTSDPFHAHVQAYLLAPGPERQAAASAFWACFEDLRSWYNAYAPIFTPPLADEKLPASLSSYYLFRQKLHALLEAGSGVSAAIAAEARSMWAVHEICYEQHLRSRARDSVSWLSNFAANLEEPTRRALLHLLQRDYPTTNMLAAACVSSENGAVSVADEFWTALPLAHVSSKDKLTIEREISSLYAANRADGLEDRGTLGVAASMCAPLAVTGSKVAGATPSSTRTTCELRRRSPSPSRSGHNGKRRPCAGRRRSRSRRSRSSIAHEWTSRRRRRSHAAGRDGVMLRPRARSRGHRRS